MRISSVQVVSTLRFFCTAAWRTLTAPPGAGLACCLLVALQANATVVHQVIVEFDDGAVTRDAARVEGATPTDITTDIAAFITGAGGGFTARGSVGRFGALGVIGDHTAPGAMSAQVSISDDSIVNPFSVPMRAVANFIIDGGEFVLVADGDGPADPASLEWQLDLFSDSLGGLFTTHFQSFLVLETTDFVNGVLTTGGADTGAFQVTPGGTRVEMPFSFQTLDLGVIPGGGVFDLQYRLNIRTSARVAEVVHFEFSDPLTLGGRAPFSVSFVPLTAVPEPPPLVMMMLALLLLALLQQRRTPLTVRR